MESGKHLSCNVLWLKCSQTTSFGVFAEGEVASVMINIELKRFLTIFRGHSQFNFYFIKTGLTKH